MSKAAIKAALRRNYEALGGDAERKKADDVIDPPFLEEIASVYRVEGKYPVLQE